MNHRRLMALLALLAVVVLVRWWDPLKPRSAQAAMAPVAGRMTSTSISRPTAATQHASVSSAGAPQAVWPVRPEQAASDTDFALISNPFSTRVEAVPLPPPHPTVVAIAKPAIPTPAPPPPDPPPALQVIGTWNDGQVRGVFIAGSDGTNLVHPGDVLMAQYKVISIDQAQVALEEISNKRRWELPIPASTDASWHSH